MTDRNKWISDEIKKTKQYERMHEFQRALEVTNQYAKISIWGYHIDKRQIESDFTVDSVLGYPDIIENVPDSLLGTGEVFDSDEPEFARMYKEIIEGAEKSECTVRMYNYRTSRYEWQHITYVRLDGDEQESRRAIGIAMNVDLQQENQMRYEHEMLIRKEFFRNAETYYQVNLTTGMIEELLSKSAELQEFHAPFPINEAFRKQLLRHVLKEDQKAFKESLFSPALLKNYQKGKAKLACKYRCITENGVCWYSGTGTVMEKPNTAELIAFVYVQEIDKQQKEEMAVDSIIEEEIESVTILNVRSGKAHHIKVKNQPSEHRKNVEFDYRSYIEKSVDANVVAEDKKKCLNFLAVENLVRELAEVQVVKLTYRTHDSNSQILRKKARAFYLDSTCEDIILVKRDITDLYEEERRHKQELQKALDASNSASRAKSEFLSHMSHDMRSPLNAILLLSGKEMNEQATEADKTKALADIHASGEYLLGIINDVLDMAKIENKKMKLFPQPYALEEFKATINTIIGEQCKRKNIDFQMNFTGATEQWVMLDKVRFNQVFVNLLSNAAKYTPAGGKVELLLEHIKVENNMIYERFIVRDNGIGMSGDFLPHAFDSFAQEQRKNDIAVEQGTGLGLTITRQIVELMGGTISIRSKLNQGTEVTVELAVEVVKTPVEAKPLLNTGEELKGLHILVCEDNPLNAKITVALLEKKDCVVTYAADGEAGAKAFSASQTGYFDLILMDIRMPVLDGLEATKKIRSMKRNDAKQVPIIALTADAFSEDIQISWAAGMNDHLSKPIDAKIFYRMIAKYAAAYRMEKDNT